VGEWVLREACRCMRRWDRGGLRIPRVAVNLSGRQFQQNTLLATIAGILQETGLAAERVELEITESILVEHALGSPIIAGLQAMGVGLAIDDFGTGYSSLSYLKRFAVDTLKIDRSFVDDVARRGDDAAITGAIISLARSLDLGVVAEGVETVEQLEFLRCHGCGAIQGYLVSPALSAGDFEDWLRRQGEADGIRYWTGFQVRHPAGNCG